MMNKPNVFKVYNATEAYAMSDVNISFCVVDE